MIDLVNPFPPHPKTMVPLGPLVLPSWVVDRIHAEGGDVEAIARHHGFDGFTTLAPSFDRPKPLAPGELNRAQRRAARRATMRRTNQTTPE